MNYHCSTINHLNTASLTFREKELTIKKMYQKGHQKRSNILFDSQLKEGNDRFRDIYITKHKLFSEP